MSVHHDRRDSKAQRIPFEAIVEIGGEVETGAFEAQSVDVSVSGMHLRTAYLPQVGQSLLCRFGSGAEDISVESEVVWRREESRGGEFGIRFTNLDGTSAAALLQMCGVNPHDDREGGQKKSESQPGTRVRLHIDGLGSPMKARVRGVTDSELLVGSNLEFLRVGRSLELEDVDRGAKRPAHIDRVDIEMERDSRVPQLVVTLRYDDVDATEGETALPAKSKSSKTSDASEEGSRWGRLRHRYQRMREGWLSGKVAGAAHRAGAGMRVWGQRARTTAGLLWGRAVEKSGERVARVRRTTSPPPTGALHASGKRVVRQAAVEETDPRASSEKASRAGKRAIVGATAGSAGMLVLLVFLLVHHSKATTASETLAAAAPLDTVIAVPADGGALDFSTATAQLAASPSASDPPRIEVVDDKKPGAEARPAVPTFGNGKLTHAVIVQVKMDGSITAMHGVRLADGFAITLPGRKTADTGAALLRLDARFSSVKVSNRSKGSELVFEFRGEVPPYLVKVRGDRLQIALGHPSQSPHAVAARTAAKERSHADDRNRAAEKSPEHGTRSRVAAPSKK